MFKYQPVMWSETKKIGLGLGLAGPPDRCNFVKHDLFTLGVIIILKDTTTFEVLFIVSLFCAWNILWRSTVAFTYSKVKFVKCRCLLPVVLVLVL